MCVVWGDLWVSHTSQERESVHVALGCAETACVVLSHLRGVWVVADVERQGRVRSGLVGKDLNVARSGDETDASLLPVKSVKSQPQDCNTGA